MESTARSKRWPLVALAVAVGVDLLAKIFADTGRHRAATWDIVTSAGFEQWPSMSLGLLMSDGWLPMSLTLVVTWIARLDRSPDTSTDVAIYILGAGFMFLVGNIWFALAYVLLGSVMNRFADIWKTEPFPQQGEDQRRKPGESRIARFLHQDLSVIMVGIIAGGFFVSLIDDRPWAPIQACDIVNGLPANQERVIPLKRDGTAIVSYDISTRQVLRADRCTRSTNQSVSRNRMKPKALS